MFVSYSSLPVGGWRPLPIDLRIFVAIFGLMMARVAANAAPAVALELTADPDTPVLEYARIAAETGGPEREVPLLRIYADGRLTVRYPVFMKRAGAWRAELGANAQQLMNTVVNQSLLETDFVALRSDLEQTEAQRQRSTRGRYVVNDDSWVRLDLRGVVLLAGDGTRQPARAVSIEWKNLPQALERHTGVAPLAALGSAVRVVERLLDHPAPVRDADIHAEASR